MFYSSFDRIVCTRLEPYYDFMYRIIILCFSYLATWLPFLNKPIDWLIDWLTDYFPVFVSLYFSTAWWIKLIKTNFSRRPEQFDGLTWLTLTPPRLFYDIYTPLRLPRFIAKYELAVTRWLQLRFEFGQISIRLQFDGKFDRATTIRRPTLRGRAAALRPK